MTTTLVFSCSHCPCMLADFPDFLADVRRQYRANHAIILGDVADNRILNYWEKNPDLPGARDEYEEAKQQIAILHKLFPNTDVLIGNHDALPNRQAKTAGIPSWFMKDMSDVWDTPTWRWHPRYHTLEHEGVLYRHGDKGRRGQYNPALLNAQRNHKSMVQGHFHALLCVNWEFNDTRGIFGMQVGCGMDHERAEMEYALLYDHKPAIGCGIVIDGQHAIVERMVR